MKIKLFLSLLVITLMAACSSAPEAESTAALPIATATSAAPEVTLYDLSVSISDQDGNPIPWAVGSIQGSSSAAPVKADEGGVLVWKGLQGASGSMTVSAQGYISAQQNLSLAEGANTIAITLEADPYQLNPADICPSGQSIIYVEDFEDGQAQDLDKLTEPKWSIEDAGEMGMILRANSTGSSAETMNWSQWGNGVWFFDLKATGSIDLDVNFHMVETTEGTNPGLSRYYLTLVSGESFGIGFERPGEGSLLAEAVPPEIPADTWRTFAIAYFNGAISVWVDDQLSLEFEHDLPIDKGRFGLQINPATEAEIWFDNLVVCSLSEPYAPVAVDNP